MQFRRDARPDLPPLDPLGSPPGCPWVSLGSPRVPLVFAGSITLLLHLASRVPFGSPWVLFGFFAFLCVPLGFLGFPLGSPWPPKCHFYVTCLMFFFMKPFILLQSIEVLDPLGPPWVPLALPWVPLDPPWVPLGPPWVPLGLRLGPLGSPLGVLGSPLAPLG